ncbi:MAG: histidine--tRNA ligase [Thermoleophilia bacterium]|nr:histidine--tRNA ligase [Thermoleophilia bacterium]
MPPKGTRDVLPAESRVRALIEGVAADLMPGHGFGRITTPTFEETDVFVHGVGTATDIVRKEMYTFTDRGGRSLTLRPEGTAPVARAYVDHGMHKLPQPVKLWYLAPMFRYEAPQSGRFREHWQVGAEAFGSDDPLLDAEMIALLSEMYLRLGVPGVRLRIASMGDPEGREPYRERLLAHLAPFADSLPADVRERMDQNPLRLFDMKDAAVRAAVIDAPRLLDNLTSAAREHHERVLEALRLMGIAYEEDSSLVRGLDYYTRTVFEFTCDSLGAQDGIGGGGRYDGLVETLGGPAVPGVGFGTGVERITLALGAEAITQPVVDVYLAIPDADIRLARMPLLRDLRRSGARVEAGPSGKGLTAMMRHAGGLGARVVIIIGPREEATGVATVRDMQTGDQSEVAVADLVARVTGDLT